MKDCIFKPNHTIEAELISSNGSATIGKPFVIYQGELYPYLRLNCHCNATVQGNVISTNGTIITNISMLELKVGGCVEIKIPGTPSELGTYEVRLNITADKECLTDTLYFTVQSSENQPCAIYADNIGKLVYVPDYRGNKIPDFSKVGYKNGEAEIPEVAVKKIVEPNGVNDEAMIQAAIDELASMPLDSNGFRGAVLLKKGIYVIKKTIRISASGIVLRGEGQGNDGTILKAAGTEKRPLILITNGWEPKPVEELQKTNIIDAYVPCGATTFHVDNPSNYKIGDTIIVQRHGNKAWIRHIGMDNIMLRPTDPSSTKQWEPFDLDFQRIITNIEGTRITIDAPVGNAIESWWGGGEIFKYDNSARLQNIGVENLQGISEYDPAVTETYKDDGHQYCSDENHAQILVNFMDIENGWAKDITTYHFDCCTYIDRNGKNITVQDCRSLEPVSIITGGRRYAFSINGQLNLVQRCYSSKSRHAFVFGSFVPGPNVFFDSLSEENYATSEPHHRWSVAGLYDNITGLLAFQDRQYMGTGHGWSGANYVVWNSKGDLKIQQPPTAQNYSIGHVGTLSKGAFEPRDPGYIQSLGCHVQPQSLYLKQLKERHNNQ